MRKARSAMRKATGEMRKARRRRALGAACLLLVASLLALGLAHLLSDLGTENLARFPSGSQSSREDAGARLRSTAGSESERASPRAAPRHLPNPPAGGPDREPQLDLAACFASTDRDAARSCFRELLRSGRVSVDGLLVEICGRIPELGPPEAQWLAGALLEDHLRASDPARVAEIAQRVDGRCDALSPADSLAGALLRLRQSDPSWYAAFLRSLSPEQVFGEGRTDVFAGILSLLGETGGELAVLRLLESGGRGEHGATWRQAALCLRTAAKAQGDPRAALEYLDSVLGSPWFETDDSVASAISMTLLERATWPDGDPRPALERVTVCLGDPRFRAGVAAQILDAHGPQAPAGIPQPQWDEVWSLATAVGRELGLLVGGEAPSPDR